MKTLTSSNKIWASKCKSLSIIHRIALSWLDSTPELRVLPGSVHRFPWKHRKPKSKAGPLVKLMKFQFEWRDNVSWATTWPARAAWEIPRSFRALATPGKFINFLGRRRLPYFSLIFPRQCWVTSVAGPVFFLAPRWTGNDRWIYDEVSRQHYAPLTSPDFIRIFLVLLGRSRVNYENWR